MYALCLKKCDVRTMEQDKILLIGSTYYGTSTQMTQNLKENHYSLNFCKKKTFHRQFIVSPPALKKDT